MSDAGLLARAMPADTNQAVLLVKALAALRWALLLQLTVDQADQALCTK